MIKEEIIKKLKAEASPKNVAGMARFGISSKNTLGVPVPFLRKLAKEIGKNHKLAQELWNSKIHEARLLAGFIAEPKETSQSLMEKWVKDFDSWDTCDLVCGNLFDKTPYAWAKALEWSKRKEEYVKRAGFVLMATLAVHDKQSADSKFLKFFPAIKREANDQRNFVKKAVNWAIRQIGKRSKFLNREAIKLCRQIYKIDDKAARWVASNALRELLDPKIKNRIKG